MSEYRDDIQETIVASDGVMASVKGFMQESVKISTTLAFGLIIASSDALAISDTVIDQSTHLVTDSVDISDAVLGHNYAQDIVGDAVSVLDTPIVTSQFTVDDLAYIDDGVTHKVKGAIVKDSVLLSDDIINSRIVSDIMSDSISLSDDVMRVHDNLIREEVALNSTIHDSMRTSSFVDDIITIDSMVVNANQSIIQDSLYVQDVFYDQRVVRSLISDQAKLSDGLTSIRSSLVDDSITIDDKLESTTNNALSIVSDALLIKDEVIDDTSNKVVIVNDTAVIKDDVLSFVVASNFIQDTCVIEDDLLNMGGLVGIAWTANADSWAMSQYKPYNYYRLFVVDGVLYGESDEGVYILDKHTYPVDAYIETGKLELSQSHTHPAYAHLEYELKGSCHLDVIQTQRGDTQVYQYVLPTELADSLTNGRFVFGRGLRGRHFAFALSMTATHGHINELVIDHQPISRRV